MRRDARPLIALLQREDIAAGQECLDDRDSHSLHLGRLIDTPLAGLDAVHQ
jgi:hypothetical protein